MSPPGAGIRLVHGAPAALEGAFLDAVVRVRRGHALAPLDVLVGSVLLRPYLQRLLAERGPGMLNVRFTTLGELGLRLGERTLIDAGRRPLPAMTARGYATEVARRAEGYFGPVAHTAGFAEATHRLVRELRQDAVDPAALERHARDAAESPAKAEALCDLYRRYLDGRADRYDGDDALAAADAALFDGTELLVFGLWRLGALGRRLLERLGERVAVTVFLPTTGSRADGAHAELRAWARDRGASETALERPAPGGTALAQLQATLFAPAAPAAVDGTVRLVSAPEPLAEVREAARTCLDWARDGIAFREMAVAYRDAATYRPLLESVLTEAGIPVYLDDGPSIAERPLGRRILALLDLIDSPLRRRDVLAFLTDGWLPRETRERYGGAPIAAWESAARRAGVVEGLDQWRGRLGSLIERERERSAREGAPEWLAERVARAESLLRFVEDVALLLAAHPERGTWAECLAALRPLVEALVQAPGDVLGHLDQLAELDELTGPVDYARFLDTVRAEIRALEAGDLDGGNQGALGLRGVSVLDVNALRHLRYRAVAVLGLTERSFPPPPRQDPLLLDDERDRLNRLAGTTLPLRARGADQEPLQFALAVCAARERLLLSTRRAQEAGARAQLPSSFFREAASALAGRRLDADEITHGAAGFFRALRPGQLGPDEPDRALTVEERDIALIERDQPLGAALLRALAPVAERAERHRRARWADRSLTPFDGVFESGEAVAAVGAWLDETSPLSPTVLETYATCPYRFFLARLLRARPLEEPETIVQLDPLTRGDAIHHALEEFLAGHTPDDLRSGDAPTLQRRLRAIADRILDGVEAEGLAGAPITWKRERTEIVDDLARWLEREIADPGTYPLRQFEVAFGGIWSGREEAPLSTETPLSLDAAGTTVRLRGRIDRLEWEPGERFRVIDYKSGVNRAKGVFEGGRALQLALYLLAAAGLLDVDVARGTASYEFVTRRGAFGSHALPGTELAAQREALDGVLGRIVGGIVAGDFHHEPGEACRFCDYRDLCDVRRVAIAKRKAGDDRRATFQAMREVV